jgi:hypothetical protein
MNIMWHITCHRLLILLGNLTHGFIRPWMPANDFEKTRDHFVETEEEDEADLVLQQI